MESASSPGRSGSARPSSFPALLFETLVQALPHLLWSTTAEGELEFLNRHAQTYTGLDVAAVQAGRWTEVVLGEDLPALEQAWRSARATGKQSAVEVRLRRAEDKQYRWHLCQWVPAVASANATPTAWLGIAIDVHPQKTTAEALRELHSRFSDVLDRLPDAFITVDHEWRITYANPAAVRLNRKPASEFVGRTHWEEWPGSVGSEVERQYRFALEHQSPVHFEHRYQAPGYDLWLEIHAYPTSSGMAIYFADVSERKRMEAALRESERLYRAIGESINFGVWVCDAEGRNIYASESFLKLVGMTQAQCSEFGWGDSLHPDDSQRTIAAWKECVRTGGTWDIEHRFRGVDGRYHPILARGVPICDENGRTVCWAGINLDLSRLKSVEEALREANRRLAASNGELERFAYVASHDLQEPLRVISSLTELLQRRHSTGLAEEGQELLALILGASDRMRRLITDLLEFSRVTHHSASTSVVDCGEAVIQALENCRSAVEESRAAVEVAALPRVICTHDRIVRLFQNLISNAIKYRREPTPEIHIGTEVFGDEIAIYVRDNGVGIAPEQHSRIFDLFSRIQGRSVEGTGVGLAIVKRIVESSAGRVWLESWPGRGSTFFFTLPLAPADESVTTPDL